MKKIFRYLIVKILLFFTRLILKKYQPKIIAITGSVGKTSGKDAIFEIIKNRELARKSEKSFNSEIGLPLTVIGADNPWQNPLGWLLVFYQALVLIWQKKSYPKTLVLEVGADRPGDISKIAPMLCPDIVVITSFGEVPVHVEFFASRDSLIAEKASLVLAAKKEALIVACGDDKDAKKIAQKSGRNFVLYGFGIENKVRGNPPEIIFEESEKGALPKIAGLESVIKVHGEVGELKINGFLGKSKILAQLSALAVAHHEKIPLTEAVNLLTKTPWQPGRQKIIAGLKESTIIDDTYNSSPKALEDALESLFLAGRGGGRKIAVLGDMLELGIESVPEHERLGKLVREKADLLITCGIRAKGFGAGAISAGMPALAVLETKDSIEAGKTLQKVLQAGDIALVKGSQSMRMEKAVEEVMKNPREKNDLLVRQDGIWEKM